MSIAKSEKKAYRRLELTNQVGSVLATLSDYKTYNVTLSHYEAVVLTATEYGVYGEVLEHREYAFEKSYTRGFNGALKEDELLGEFNAYDLGSRMYSARLGRQLSTDPREGEYPWQSTYAYYGNSPISIIDFMGMGDDDECCPEEEKGSWISIGGLLDNGNRKIVWEGDVTDIEGLKEKWKSNDIELRSVGYTYHNPESNVTTVLGERGTSYSWTPTTNNSLGINPFAYSNATLGWSAGVRTAYVFNDLSLYRFRLSYNITGNVDYLVKGSTLRNQGVLNTRAYTPEPYRSMSEGIKSGSSLKVKPYGSFWKPNIKVTTGVVVGAGVLNLCALHQSYRRVSQAHDPYLTLLDEACTWTYAIGGGSLAAEYTPGPLPLKFVAGILGSIGGVAAKNEIQKLWIKKSNEIQSNFTPTLIKYPPLFPAYSTRTHLTPIQE